MAKEYDIDIYSQQSLYQADERTCKIYFSEPETGVKPDTGILLLISGYGGEANSNVYKKMRRVFADQYNLVTVQCDYFGWEYMQVKSVKFTAEILQQNLTSEELKLLLNDPSKLDDIMTGKDVILPVKQDETLSNFNDMGLVQAMDHLIAMKVIDDILTQNNLVYNKRRIIVNGMSHGAYIAYMCNALMPGVFTTIIDNSGYLYPEYMEKTRTVMRRISDKYTIAMCYDYLIKQIVFDKEIYRLPYCYSQISNQAHIISFHGISDNMTTFENKLRFLDGISNVDCKIITEQDVDHEIFANTEHGLGADFLKLFSYVMDNYNTISEYEGMCFKNHTLQTKNYRYIISNEDGIPLLRCESRGGKKSAE